jgi:hypothetical protein
MVYRRKPAVVCPTSRPRSVVMSAHGFQLCLSMCVCVCTFHVHDMFVCMRVGGTVYVHRCLRIFVICVERNFLWLWKKGYKFRDILLKLDPKIWGPMVAR